MVIIWGVEHGQCLIKYGAYEKGFRQEFDNAKDADLFIRLQCNRINRDEIISYGMYITNEYKTLDDVMHYHNLKTSDSTYRDLGKGIEDVDIVQIKNHIDLMWQLEQKKLIKDKLKIDKTVRDMDAAEKQYQTDMFKKLNVNLI